MSLRKVYGGTPVHGESCCDTCVLGQVIQGYAESQRIVFCNSSNVPIRIPFKVMQCSDYQDRRLPDYYEMKQIAWQIRSKSAGHEAGFVTIEKPQGQQEPKEET